MNLIRVKAWGRYWQNVDRRKARKLYDCGETLAICAYSNDPVRAFNTFPRYSKASTCGQPFDWVEAAEGAQGSKRLRYFAPLR